MIGVPLLKGRKPPRRRLLLLLVGLLFLRPTFYTLPGHLGQLEASLCPRNVVFDTAPLDLLACFRLVSSSPWHSPPALAKARSADCSNTHELLTKEWNAILGRWSHKARRAKPSQLTVLRWNLVEGCGPCWMPLRCNSWELVIRCLKHLECILVSAPSSNVHPQCVWIVRTCSERRSGCGRLAILSCVPCVEFAERRESLAIASQSLTSSRSTLP